MDRRSHRAGRRRRSGPIPWIFPLLCAAGFGSAAVAGPLAGVGPLTPEPPLPGAARAEFRAMLLESGGEPLKAQRVVHPEEEALHSMSGRAVQEERAARIPPGLAFLMSAAVPGSGQLAEGKRRAFLYLGLEAFAWISHFAWKDAGNKKEGEYEAYARRHWDLDRWRVYAYGDVDTCLDALPPGIDPAEAEQTLLDFIEAGNEQHFYEDIGKLEAYRAGWDDFGCGDPDALSPNRRVYRSMRADSNDFLARARLMTTVAFLNRVVSSVDAYRTSRGARLSVGENTDLELGLAGLPSRPRASLALRTRW